MSASAAGLRIGDAERAAAADLLARHFSHGRLDQGELDDRLDRVIRATTAGDLTEVFADLPADVPVTAASGSGQRRPVAAGRPTPARVPRLRGLAVVVLAVCVLAAISVHALARPIVVLAVAGLIAAIWLRRGRVRKRGSPPWTR